MSDDNYTKACSKCKRVLPLTCFSLDKSKRDGLFSSCKNCVAEYHRKERIENPDQCKTREKRSWDKNKDKANARRRERYAQNPTPFRQQNKARRQKRIEQERERDRTRYIRERDKRAVLSRQYYLSHKHVYRAAAARRMARERGLPNAFTADDWNRALSYFNNCCAACNRPQGLWHKIAADHWIPLASPDCPGTIPTNIVPLCHGIDGCNTTKKDADAQSWLIRRFGNNDANKIMRRIEEFFEWVALHQ